MTGSSLIAASLISFLSNSNIKVFNGMCSDQSSLNTNIDMA